MPLDPLVTFRGKRNRPSQTDVDRHFVPRPFSFVNVGKPPRGLVVQMQVPPARTPTAITVADERIFADPRPEGPVRRLILPLLGRLVQWVLFGEREHH